MLRLNLNKDFFEQYEEYGLSWMTLGNKVHELSHREISSRSIYNYKDGNAQPSLKLLGYIQLAIQQIVGEKITIEDITTSRETIQIDSISIPDKYRNKPYLKRGFFTYSEAIDSFKEALEDTANDDEFESAILYYLLGAAYLFHGDFYTALENFVLSEEVIRGGQDFNDENFDPNSLLLIGCIGYQAECQRLLFDLSGAASKVIEALNITAHWMYYAKIPEIRSKFIEPNTILRLEGRLLRVYGDILRCQGRLTLAYDRLERSIFRARQIGDIKGEIEACNILADVLCDQSDYVAAREYLEFAQGKLKTIYDVRLQAYNLLGLARASRRQAYENKFLQPNNNQVIGYKDAFEQYVFQAREIFNAIEHKLGLAHCEYNHIKQTKYTKEDSLDRFLAVRKKFKGLKEIRLVAYIDLSLGDIYLRRQDRNIEMSNQAHTLFKEALAIFRGGRGFSSQDDRGVALTALRLGQIYRNMGSLNQAENYFEIAVKPLVLRTSDEKDPITNKVFYNHPSVLARSLRGLGSTYQNRTLKIRSDIKNNPSYAEQGRKELRQSLIQSYSYHTQSLQISSFLIKQKQTKAFAYLAMGYSRIKKAQAIVEGVFKDGDGDEASALYAQAESYFSTVEELLNTAIEDPRIKGYFHLYRAYLYRANFGELAPEEIRRNLESAEKEFLSEFTNEFRGVGYVYSSLLEYYTNIVEDDEKATEYKFKAIEQFKKIPDYIGLWGVYSLLEKVAIDKGNSNDAKEYASKANEVLGKASYQDSLDEVEDLTL